MKYWCRFCGSSVATDGMCCAAKRCRELDLEFLLREGETVDLTDFVGSVTSASILGSATTTSATSASVTWTLKK